MLKLPLKFVVPKTLKLDDNSVLFEYPIPTFPKTYKLLLIVVKPENNKLQLLDDVKNILDAVFDVNISGGALNKLL